MDNNNTIFNQTTINKTSNSFSNNNPEEKSNPSKYDGDDKKKKKRIAIIITIAIILIAAGIVLIICLTKKRGDGKIKINDGLNKPTVNIIYNQDEIKIFDVEKNISSKIIGETDDKLQNIKFKYLCILGVKDKLSNENSKNLYEGFFAILNTSVYNEEILRYEVIYRNENLQKILNSNKLKDNSSLNNKEGNFHDVEYEDNKDKKEEFNLFLKIAFYQNGTYKEILRPNHLSDINFNEMKELLDLILPKIETKSLSLESSSNYFGEQIRKEKLIKIKEDKLLNREYKKNHLKILRLKDLRNLDENEDNNGYLP